MNFSSFREKILNCTLCELYKTRSNLVLDDTESSADIFFIGEAPGGHEDTVSGKPFTGDAGGKLEEMIEGIGLKRNKVYLGNAVKCRPVKPSSKGRYNKFSNRRPTKKEIEICKPWLIEEIRNINPKVTVALGGVPLSVIINKNVQLKDFHGREIYWEDMKLPVFVLYHPAAITYNPGLKEVYKKDFILLKKFLEKHKAI
jgi:DNA polymerase